MKSESVDQKFVLPYLLEDASKQNEPFSFNMEIAAIVCLADGQRKKRFLGGSFEKISLISKMHYLLWRVPWEDGCLIVDSLGVSAYKDEYLKPPDTKTFTEDLLKIPSVREEFHDTLKKHVGFFEDFVATVDITLNAIAAGKTLLGTLLEYFKHETPLNEDTETLAIPPDLKKENALESCRKVIEYLRQVQADIKGFQYALRILKEKTNIHEHGILCEIEQLQEKYTTEISNLEPTVAKKIKNLTRKQGDEIAKITKVGEKKLKTASREKEKLERKMQTLRQNALLLQKKVEAYKSKRDEARVARWKYELKRRQDEVDRINGKIKSVSRLIERIHKETEAAVKEVEDRYQMMIKDEESRITSLTALRDSETAAKRKELKEMLSESSHVKNLIEHLTERKRLQVQKIEEETMVPLKQNEVALIYLPFYLVKYERDAKSRYRIYPPTSVADHGGIAGTVQRDLRSFSLESRVDLMLRPRSEELSETLSSALISKMGNKSFEEKISATCRSHNILSTVNFKDVLTQGLRELEEEGWIDTAESDKVIKEYGGIE